MDVPIGVESVKIEYIFQRNAMETPDLNLAQGDGY